MPDVRELLQVSDARIDEALAEVMGWRKENFPIKYHEVNWIWWPPNIDVGYSISPPAYCSPDSPRRLLEEVEERITDVGVFKAIDDICDHPISWWALAQRAYLLKAGLRARAALWVLDTERAERLIAEVQQNA